MKKAKLMKPNTATRKGVETENSWVEYLKAHGVVNAERRRLQGSADRGDISGWCHPKGNWTVVSEVKSGAVLKIPEWISELRAEIANDNADTGHIVVRPKGKPDPSDWFIVLPVDIYMDLMKRASFLV